MIPPSTIGKLSAFSGTELRSVSLSALPSFKLHISMHTHTDTLSTLQLREHREVKKVKRVKLHRTELEVNRALVWNEGTTRFVPD
jgi:hypothetical protein